jgi:aminoglycoside/choline kinase family phosphotransferase
MPEFEFPRSPQELTPDWLTSILRSTGVIQDSLVTNIELERVGAGSGFMAECARVILKYDTREADAPSTLIAKFSNANLDSSSAMYDQSKREVQFYAEWANEVDIKTPAAYFGSADQNSRHHILLLEDLSNTRHGDDLTGGSYDDALLAVRQLARMHADWWHDPRLVNIGPYRERLERQQAFATAWPICVENISSHLSESNLRIGELLCTRLGGIVEHLDERPQTLIHGDFRYANMFFNSDNDQVRLTAFDWELFGSGCATYDMSYFVASSLRIDQRREFESTLLNEYHRVLVRRGVDDYDFETFYHDYKLSFAYFLELWVLTAAYLELTDLRGIEYLSVSMKRLDAIVADHDVEVLISSQPIT